MNPLGHQSIQGSKEPDGSLRAHPKGRVPDYADSIRPNAPGVFEVATDLMDEVADALEAGRFHYAATEK